MFVTVDTALLRHPKTMRLRRLLMDPRAALYVIELWSWCTEYAKDGDLSDLSAEEIEEGLGWTLDAGKLYGALCEAGFIDRKEDGRTVVHDWDKHQGRWIAKMESERKRLKDWRSGRRKTDKPEKSEDEELVETVLCDGVQPELPLRTSTVHVRETYGTSSVRDNLTKPNQDKTNQDKEKSICAETAPPSSPPVPPVLVFPCDGDPGSWDLTATAVSEWSELFPSLEIADQCRKALAWVKASPQRRKTASGMPRFLVGWFGRAQNQGPGPPTRASPAPTPTTGYAAITADKNWHAGQDKFAKG